MHALKEFNALDRFGCSRSAQRLNRFSRKPLGLEHRAAEGVVTRLIRILVDENGELIEQGTMRTRRPKRTSKELARLEIVRIVPQTRFGPAYDDMGFPDTQIVGGFVRGDNFV